MKKTFTILICAILICVCTISLVACGGVQRNVGSVSCAGARGEAISFGISANKAFFESGYSWFIDGSTQITSMVDKMRSSSAKTYEYDAIKGSNDETVAYRIYAKYSTQPTSYILRTAFIGGDEGFEMFEEVASCAFNQALAFPLSLLQDGYSFDVRKLFVEYGSAYVVNGDIEDVKKFYEENNYTAETSGDALILTDKMPNYAGSKFRIEFSEISTEKSLMTFVRTY